jgi:molecular chaperone HscB
VSSTVRVTDYFAIFGLRPAFGIDRAALERKFYELSRAFHPDRFTTSGAQAQRESLEKMSELNEAYRTLKDPALLRDHYLELAGVGSEAKPNQQIPVELAEAWFELQDALTEDPPGALAKIALFEADLAQLRSRGAQKLVELEQEIDQVASDAPKKELLEKLSREIRAQSYLKSMERDVERIKKRL